MAKSPQRSVKSLGLELPTKDLIQFPDPSLLLSPSSSYSGLLQPSNPFSAFQIFPADPLYQFPQVTSSDDDETHPQPLEFIDASEVVLKVCLQGLQEESPFKRGHAEVFQDEPSPSTPPQEVPENSIDSQPQRQDSISVYNDLSHMSRDLFRDSLSQPRASEHSDAPSRTSISLTTREVLHNIQREFAARQDDRHLHSITPESSFFRESKATLDSVDFNPGESRTPFEVDQSISSFRGTDVMISGDDDGSFMDLEQLRPSLYRKSHAFDSVQDSEDVSMSIVEEGSAYRLPIFRIGTTFSRAGTIQMPEILEEDSSSGYTPHSHLGAEAHTSPPAEEGEVSLPSIEKSRGGHTPLPKAIFIPEKILTRSMTPTSFATFAETSFVSPKDAYSPLISKFAVFSQKSKGEYELQAAWALSGFTSVASVEFSNIAKKSRGRMPSSLALLPSTARLFSNKVLVMLLRNEVQWVTCGFEHAAILTASGRVFTWGYGGAGVLGHGDTNSVTFPRAVAALAETTIVHIQSGAYHTAAVSSGGDLWTWGRGDMFQLGHSRSLMFKDDMGNVVLRPQIVAYFSSNSINVRAVACGEAHTLVLDSEGAVYSFGWGAYGQLGLGPWDIKQSGAEKIHKIRSLAEAKVITVSCGLVFSACITDTGQVWVWGSGDSGQLGVGGSIKKSLTPIRLESLLHENIIDIVCGESHALVLSRSGLVYAWGTGLAGVFHRQGNSPSTFCEGSDIVCYVPQQLARLDIVCRFLTTSTTEPSAKQDSLAIGLMAKLKALQNIDRSVDSSM